MQHEPAGDKSFEANRRAPLAELGGGLTCPAFDDSNEPIPRSLLLGLPESETLMQHDRIEQGVNLVIAAAAIVIAGAVAYRQFRPSPVQPVGAAITVTYVADWRELLSAGRQVANPAAEVQLLEFVDLECPACQAFARTLTSVRNSYPSTLGVTLIHYPLPMHSFARRAARVAECGALEGKFDEIVTVILNDRDSLSRNRWTTYGDQVGIRDRASFDRCQADTAAVPMIESGLVAAERAGARATPTILLNGWRFSTTPTESEIRRTIEALLRGDQPPMTIR